MAEGYCRLGVIGVMCLTLLHVTIAAVRGIDIKDSCGKHIVQNMTDIVSYIVTWDGKVIPASPCMHSFTGHSSIYTVCFETMKYQVEDCDIKLVYSEENGHNAKNYSCGEAPGPWCASPGSTANIALEGATVAPGNTTGFKILVIATKQDKDLYLKLGIVIGVVVIIGTVFVVLLYCIRKRSQIQNVKQTGYTKFDD